MEFYKGIDSDLALFKATENIVLNRPCCGSFMGEINVNGLYELLLIYDDIMAWIYFMDYWPFVMGIHRWPVDSPHKGPVTWCFDVVFVVSLYAVESYSGIYSDVTLCKGMENIVLNRLCYGSFMGQIFYNGLYELMVKYDEVMACICIVHYWPFMGESHQWPVDSPNKGLVMWSLIVF